jgi:nodulation protein E
MSTRRVVITGTGVVSAIGTDTGSFWESIIRGSSGIGPFSSVDPDKIRFKNGAEVRNFYPEDHFHGKELDMMDRFSQFALVAAKEAVRQSGVEFNDEKGSSSAVICGTSIGGVIAQETAYSDLYRENKSRVHPLSIPKTMPNSASSIISMHFGITGPVYTVSTACASSNHAIGNAFWLIRNGICERAIAGGSETPFTYTFLKSWEALRVVAQDTCRPFSMNRQGMILGEGGAMIVLESLESAKDRGAEILGEIIGFGMSSDASHITKPDQAGAERAMKMALKDAKVLFSDVDYINTHGTGTPVNDKMETAAIKNVFGSHAKALSVSSTKSMHGHLLGGTSAVEAVATIMALKNDILPPTANYEIPDPECDLDVVPNICRYEKLKYALSNSFAFGGLNAVLAFRKWEGK